MAAGDTYFNVVRFTPGGDGGGAAILLESPWKIAAGVRHQVNRAVCSHVEYDKLGGQLGVRGTVDFCFGDPQAGDLSLAEVLLQDAEPVEYGTSPDGDDIVTKYRLLFVDDRYRFAEPRGGRLNLGLLNPSYTQAPDPDLDKKPATHKLSELIGYCLKAMGLDGVDVPDEADDVDPPEDLKWFGTHAPTELAKLLAMADCVLVLQPDATYEIYHRGDGADPQIPDGRALPPATLDGSDGRGKTVVFTSFPTQIAMVLRADPVNQDFEPTNFEVVARNADGAWVPIDKCGKYGVSAIATVNGHFGSPAASPADQEAAFRYLRLDPDIYDPLVSPLLRKAWADPPKPTDAKKMPDQVEMVIKAIVAVPDPVTRAYRNSPGPVPVPIVGTYDGNVVKLGLRLVKLPDGTPSTTDLEGRCVAVDTHDLQCRIAVGQSEYDAERKLWKPGYFYVGFSGTAAEMATLEGPDAEAAMSDPDAVVVTLPDLLAIQYGEMDDPFNKQALTDRCKALAARYLQDAAAPPRLLADVGFMDFTFDGTLTEVEVDQAALLTRFRMDSWFRPAGSYLASEFERLRQKQEKHPHQAEVQGERQSIGASGSSAPVQPMDHYAPVASGLPAATAKYQVLTTLDDTLQWVADDVRLRDASADTSVPPPDEGLT